MRKKCAHSICRTRQVERRLAKNEQMSSDSRFALACFTKDADPNLGSDPNRNPIPNRGSGQMSNWPACNPSSNSTLFQTVVLNSQLEFRLPRRGRWGKASSRECRACSRAFARSSG
eukprot:6179916-Pleurochrysis_carterae.AAC.1